MAISSEYVKNKQSDIFIRLAILADAEAIAKVHLKSWRESYKGLISQNYLDDLSLTSRLKARQKILTENNNEKITIVPVHNQEIIGFCDAGPAREQSSIYKGEIYAIYLLEKYKHQGVGSQLLAHMRKHFHKNSLFPFIIWVLENNKPACEFYKKHGGQIYEHKTTKIGDEKYQELGYIFYS